MGAEIVALIIVGIVSVASGIVSVATCLRVERQLETIEVHNTGVEINNEMTTEVKNEANGTETKTVKKGQHIRISSLDNKLLFEASSVTETGRPNEVANKTASIASGATKFLEGPATIAGATTEALGNMIKKHQSDKSKPVVEQKLLGIQETSEEDPNPQSITNHEELLALVGEGAKNIDNLDL